jgi:hypothetical protein
LQELLRAPCIVSTFFTITDRKQNIQENAKIEIVRETNSGAINPPKGVDLNDLLDKCQRERVKKYGSKVYKWYWVSGGSVPLHSRQIVLLVYERSASMGLMVQGYNPVCTMSCFGPKIPA